MKRQNSFIRLAAVIMSVFTVFLAGCGSENGESSLGHQHVFDCKVSEAQYLKSEQTCTEAKQYYYSCACGEKGIESYEVGVKGLHDYSAEKVGEEYVYEPATCQKKATYYRSCVYCGRSSNSKSMLFTAGELGMHAYVNENPSGKFLKEEATFEKAAEYYKSCTCGEVGTETFVYGNPLKVLTEEEKEAYKPVSLTMSLYEPEKSIYGFTYNTEKEPLRPVIQYEKGTVLTENAQEVSASFSQWSSYDDADKEFRYYIVKAEVEFEPSETYTYRVYDKYADIGCEPVTFQTRDTQSSSFTFSHVSDTQSVPSSGWNFGLVLDYIQNTSDFVLHTGDVVEWSKYEYEWKAMLDTNFKYLSKMPVMGIAGNHDTTYKSSVNEFWKHFNNKIPEQESTSRGYYYSFTYGNAKFIMLNTNNNESADLEKTQYDWLIEELENNESDWLFVGMHAPLYSIGQWGADPEKNSQSLALRGQLAKVFAQYGVDIVFQGHDHLLSRTNPINADCEPTAENWQTYDGVEYTVDPSGVIYVMDGTVGTNPKGVVGVEEGIYNYAQESAACTWANITIDGNTLTFEARKLDATYKKWGIKKTDVAA